MPKAHSNNVSDLHRQLFSYLRGYLMLVFITSSWSSSSSGTKPRPPHVGHCCSSSVPSTTPSPLQSGQVFMCASWDALPQPRDYIRWCFADPAIAARPHDVRFTAQSAHSACRTPCPLCAISGLLGWWLACAGLMGKRCSTRQDDLNFGELAWLRIDLD